MEKISIIIPVYRAERWLEECVNSCLNQKHSLVEIVLIDDGSPDESGIICDRLSQIHSNVITIHQENAGVSAARNRGIAAASGDLLAFVDSDDTIAPEMMERLLAARKRYNHVDLIMCGYDEVFEGYTNEMVCRTEIYADSKIACMEFLSRRDTFGVFRSACGKLFKKTIIQEYCLRFDPKLKYGEDFCFVMQYLCRCESVYYLQEALYHYRQETYDKTTHYQRNDVDYQLDNGLSLHRYFKDSFINTGTYDVYKRSVDGFLPYRIKMFMNDMVSVGAPRKRIFNALQRFKKSEFYSDFAGLSLQDISDPLERCVLFGVKHNLLRNLYYLFVVKNVIHNGR